MTRSKIRTSGAEGLTLSSTSLTVADGLTLTDGNVTMASGHGVTFAATSDGTSMTSELFDDYEEGFIAAPVVKINGTVCTLSSTSGLWYAKIGRIVIGSVEFRIGNYNGGSAGQEVTVDLPFTSASYQYSTGAVRIYDGTVTGREFSTVQANEALLKFNNNNDGGVTTNMTASIGAYIYTSFAYTAT
jgi:hypothetical protein